MIKITSCVLLLLVVCFGNLHAQPDSWFWQNPIPQGNKLNSIFAIDGNNVFGAGECGIVIKSTNSGLSWVLTHLPDTGSFNSIYFIDNNTGWIAGGIYRSPNMVNVIYKTTNSGLSWFQQNTNLSD